MSIPNIGDVYEDKNGERWDVTAAGIYGFTIYRYGRTGYAVNIIGLAATDWTRDKVLVERVCPCCEGSGRQKVNPT